MECEKDIALGEQHGKVAQYFLEHEDAHLRELFTKYVSTAMEFRMRMQ